METLDRALERARSIDVDGVADAIEEIGFECTDCGDCCRGDGEGDQAHVAVAFPDEIRDICDTTDNAWSDVARPMPFGLASDGTGETFEWALQVDDCGDCAFHRGGDAGGWCGIYDARPRICRTYPFQIPMPGTAEPDSHVVEECGPVEAFECEGLGRSISREDAESLAQRVKERTIAEITEAKGVLEHYAPRDHEGAIVHDSGGAKRPDGTPLPDSPT